MVKITVYVYGLILKTSDDEGSNKPILEAGEIGLDPGLRYVTKLLILRIWKLRKLEIRQKESFNSKSEHNFITEIYQFSL